MTGASNRALGNSFEDELCTILKNNGFWAHNMAQKKSGQPADVIAVKGGYPSLIDCKVCSDDVFELSRVESNQQLAMEYWHSCGNGLGLFALKFKDGDIRMVSYHTLSAFALTGKKCITKAVACAASPSLEEWMKGVSR